MFIIVEWPDGEPPKLGNDLMYPTKDEGIVAAEFILSNPPHRYSQLNRLTVHPVGGVGNSGEGAAWDSEAWTAGLPR